ncbi:hypothetical protein [Methylocucumis oryzae]|uniref:hypothetical protein n=1 Tax=Methylocucumis oryzae TaxID=1632867 RepID=UPI0023BAFFDB|nr:hypothetical protein [Methylocucumis oryzae]
MVSVDIYRPAAIKQLQTLAEDSALDFFPSDDSQNPVDIAKKTQLSPLRKKKKKILRCHHR